MTVDPLPPGGWARKPTLLGALLENAFSLQENDKFKGERRERAAAAHTDYDFKFNYWKITLFGPERERRRRRRKIRK